MGAAANQFLRNQAAPEKTEGGSILVVTADGKGVLLVKADTQRLTCFEEKSLRPGNRRMATVCGVYSIDAYDRTAESVVAALFRDTKDRLERTGMRWSTEGARGMLNLRSIRASKLWDDFQNHNFATSSLTA